MVRIAPVLTFLFGHLYVERLGPPEGPPIHFREKTSEWRSITTLGFAFMLCGLVTTIGHLAVLALVQRELGAEALRQFQVV